MKNCIILIFALGLGINLFAQTNDLVVFSEKGEEFTLYVNSIQQNASPAANVKAKDIKGDSFMARLVFVNKSIPEITQNFWTESKNVEISAVVILNKKGKYVLRLMGEAPKVADAIVVNNIDNATYEDPGAPSNSSNSSSQSSVTTTTVTTERVPRQNIDVSDNISTNVNTNTTGLNVTTTGGGETLNMNVTANEHGLNLTTGVGGETVNINLSVSGTQNMEVTNYQETVTTTSTTTTTGGTTIVPSDDYASNSSGTISRCPTSMSDNEFSEALASIKSKSFEDSKLITAKQICKNECMTAEQIRDINKIFGFEETRLEFAKYAYDFVYDSSKYYKINDSFSFEMSIEELNEYLETK